MKTRIKNLLLLLLLLGLPGVVQAQFTFTTNSGAITITSHNPAAGLNVVIPASTNGYPVTAIGTNAFYGLTTITNVTIGTNVTSIEDGAFWDCTSLTSVTIWTNYSARYYRLQMPWPPLAITTGAAFGFTNGMFGFDVTGPSGTNVVIQASSDLQTWMPVQTNLLGSSPLYFSDPHSTTNTQHFYRAQLSP